MKYCNFWYLICSIWASILAKSTCQNWHSRARGVANLENVIPMLGGKHYFFWFPCSVGMRISLFQHLCGEDAIKHGFLTFTSGYCKFCHLRRPCVLHFFWLFWKVWFPPSVGITFSKWILERWIAAMQKCENIIGKHSKNMFWVSSMNVLFVCNSEQAQWNNDIVWPRGTSLDRVCVF